MTILRHRVSGLFGGAMLELKTRVFYATMNVQEFISHLSRSPELNLRFRLPSGGTVPAHFHITEVGHVTKRFVDCGGTRRLQETCLLQTWVHEDVEHRLTAGKLAKVFEHAADVLPAYDLPVEVEHELEGVSQFRVEAVSVRGEELVFELGNKQTDCLARGVCLPDRCGPPAAAIAEKQESTCCDPRSGCC